MMLPEPGPDLRPQNAPETVKSALQTAMAILREAGSESAGTDAAALLAAALNMAKEQLYIRPERVLTAEESSRYYDVIWRRSRSEPVAYITGRREFWSLELCVAEGVFIPRPETELLVELSLKFLDDHCRDDNAAMQVLDLCAGCGAIAVALAQQRRNLEVWGTDLSPQAVEMARFNAARYGLGTRCSFLEGDLFTPVSNKKKLFDVIVSNPPYIPSADLPTLPADVRDWEPALALDGGADGIMFYRRIFAQAPVYLKEHGLIAVEIGADLETQVREVVNLSGLYHEAVVYADYSGRARVVSARKLPS